MMVTIDLFGYSAKVDQEKKTIFYTIEEKNGMFFLYKTFNNIKSKKRFLVESRKKEFYLIFDETKSLRIAIEERKEVKKEPIFWKNLENSEAETPIKNKTKKRKCLKCDSFFLSSGPGERLCPQHKSKISHYEISFLGEDCVYG